MAEGKFTYDCRDEGYNCDWTCQADGEAELEEKVKAHMKERHSL